MKKKEKITAGQILVRRAIDKFIDAPDFETFFNLRAYIEDSREMPCRAVGCLPVLDINKCNICPLYSEKQMEEDNEWICDFSSDDGMPSLVLLEFWREHNGEILLAFVQFKEFWK